MYNNNNEERETTTKLFPVKKNGKYGYINSAGDIVIEPKYDKAEVFSDNLARVMIPPQPTAQTITKEKKSAWGLFLESFSRIKASESVEKRDSAGWFAVDPQFDYARDFSNGLAEVTIDNKIG